MRRMVKFVYRLISLTETPPSVCPTIPHTTFHTNSAKFALLYVVYLLLEIQRYLIVFIVSRKCIVEGKTRYSRYLSTINTWRQFRVRSFSAIVQVRSCVIEQKDFVHFVKCKIKLLYLILQRNTIIKFLLIKFLI